MNSIAEYVRQNVPMRDICTKYGFWVNRAGFISCPFHREKTASLKIYKGARGWHCFGCGLGGSNIDFVELLFNKDFKEAIKIIISDFNLPVAARESSYRDKIKAQRRFDELAAKTAERQKRQLAAEREYDRLLNKWICNDIIICGLKPATHDEELADVYVKAIHEQPIIEYKLDCLGVK